MIPLILALFLVQQGPAPARPDQAAPPAATVIEPSWSTRSRIVDLMSDRDTYPVMLKHIPHIIAQIEGHTGISIPLDFTLEDFLHVPEAQIGRKELDAINVDLAKIR